MPTYLSVVQRVGLECLNRTDLNPEIKNGVLTTIRSMEAQRFWFNETQTILTCVAGVEAINWPANFMFETRLEVTYGNAQVELLEKSFDHIRQVNVTMARGIPTVYAGYGVGFHLANVPDSAYPIPCYYVKKLDPLSADTDTNEWLSAAEDVVVYGAAAYVAAGVIGNDSAASKFMQLQNSAYKSRLLKLRDQEFTNRIRATRF